MFLLNILEAGLAYGLVKIRFIKEKEVILNGNTNDKSRGIQLIGPGYSQKVIKGVNWLLFPIIVRELLFSLCDSLINYQQDAHCQPWAPGAVFSEASPWNRITV